MPGYDFFSQPEGPKIDISLFGDASLQGAELGKATPTALTSAIQGVTKGVETGLDLSQKYENTQLTQAQTRNENAIADINTLKAQVASQTQEAAVEAAKLELSAKAADTKSHLSDLKAQNDIPQKLASQDPNDRKSVLTDPEYSTYLLKNPKYAEQVVGSLIQRGDLTEAEQEKAYRAIDFSKSMGEQNRIKEINARYQAGLQTELEKAISGARDDGQLASLFVGKNLSDIATKLEAFPEGQKQTTADGKIIPGADASFDMTSGVKTYEVFDNGKKTGLTVGPMQYEKLYKLKNSYYSSIGRTKADSPVSAPPAPGNTPTAPTASTTTPDMGRPGASQVTNSSIVTQRQAQFKEVAKNPPPGISGGVLEDRLAQKRKEVKSMFSSPTVQGGSGGGGGGEVTPTPTQKPPSADAALSDAVGAPVKLKTDVSFSPSPTTWDRINSDPLISGEPALIKGLATVESAGQRGATSDTGVVGLLQVTKSVAAHYGYNRDDPQQNVLAGKKYLYDNLVRFNGDLRLSLSAYNAGPSLVSEAVREVGSTDWNKVKGYLKDNLSEKKFAEVEHYADKVLSSASHYVSKGNTSDKDFIYLLQENGLIAS